MKQFRDSLGAESLPLSANQERADYQHAHPPSHNYMRDMYRDIIIERDREGEVGG